MHALRLLRRFTREGGTSMSHEFWWGVLFGAGGLIAINALALAVVVWIGSRTIEGDEDSPWGSL